MYGTDHWINEGSSWIIQPVDSEYVNISAYSPLVGSTYIELPDELKHPMKDLINIKNNDHKYFSWCHIRHLSIVERNPQRITRKDKEMISELNNEGVKFTVSKKEYSKVETQKIFILMCFAMRIN